MGSFGGIIHTSGPRTFLMAKKREGNWNFAKYVDSKGLIAVMRGERYGRLLRYTRYRLVEFLPGNFAGSVGRLVAVDAPFIFQTSD